MLTSKDFQQLERTFITKDEFKGAVGELVDLIITFQKSMEERFNRVEAKLYTHADILNTHEHHLDRLEDKVFSPQ